jgi:hypothetical protein
MDQFVDSIARILAMPASRRHTFRLLGAALATAVFGGLAVEPLGAAVCTSDQIRYGAKTCGGGPNASCCAANQCCATGGRDTTGSPRTGVCCSNGACYCANGRCAASSGGRCPGGCTLCKTS